MQGEKKEHMHLYGTTRRDMRYYKGEYEEIAPNIIIYIYVCMYVCVCLSLSVCVCVIKSPPPPRIPLGME